MPAAANTEVVRHYIIGLSNAKAEASALLPAPELLS